MKKSAIEKIESAEEEMILICPSHKKEIPLIWTFAFPGAEYWCPHCGYTCGMFGNNKGISATDSLKQFVRETKEKASRF